VKGHWSWNGTIGPWMLALVCSLIPREPRSVFRSLVIAPKMLLKRPGVGAAVAEPARIAAAMAAEVRIVASVKKESGEEVEAERR
jgi:hypothetical protein